MAYKIKKTKLFKKGMKKVPKNIKKEVKQKLKEIAENPFTAGEPVKKEDLWEVMMIMIEQRFDLIPDEVKSLYLSNTEYFKKNSEEDIIMELSS